MAGERLSSLPFGSFKKCLNWQPDFVDRDARDFIAGVTVRIAWVDDSAKALAVPGGMLLRAGRSDSKRTSVRRAFDQKAMPLAKMAVSFWPKRVDFRACSDALVPKYEFFTPMQKSSRDRLLQRRL
jgi:hypothetical protein